jgi:hypothetical protein
MATALVTGIDAVADPSDLPSRLGDEEATFSELVAAKAAPMAPSGTPWDRGRPIRRNRTCCKDPLNFLSFGITGYAASKVLRRSIDQMPRERDVVTRPRFWREAIRQRQADKSMNLEQKTGYGFGPADG